MRSLGYSSPLLSSSAAKKKEIGNFILDLLERRKNQMRSVLNSSRLQQGRWSTAIISSADRPSGLARRSCLTAQVAVNNIYTLSLPHNHT
jgi:hypothetical protein